MNITQIPNLMKFWAELRDLTPTGVELSNQKLVSDILKC